MKALVTEQRTEGPRGSEVVAWATIPEALSPWIEAAWYSEGWLAARQERVLPSATGDLVVNLGPAMRLVEGVGDPIICGATTTGLLTAPIVLGHPVWHRAVGFRLRPLATRSLLGVPVAALNDRCETLAAVLGAPGVDFEDRLRDAHTPAEVLGAALDWAAARLARGPEPDPLVAWAVKRLTDPAGPGAIAALVARSGYGATRFNGRFVAEVGCTPKRFARLVRFRAALDGLRPGVSLARLALDTGHSDQAHLCAEFQAFAGRSPTEVLAAAHPAGLTLAEDPSG